MKQEQVTLEVAMRRAEPGSREWVKLHCQIWEMAALIDELSDEGVRKVQEFIALLKSCDELKGVAE